MTDEQIAREWLLPLLQDMVAKVLSDHTVLKKQQRIIEQIAALLARRALEARKEALEKAARECESWGDQCAGGVQHALVVLMTPIG